MPAQRRFYDPILIATAAALLVTLSFTTPAAAAAAADGQAWGELLHKPYPLARIAADTSRSPESNPQTSKVSQHSAFQDL